MIYDDFSIATLWLCNIAMENGPSLDGLPIKNGHFPWQTVSHNQRVTVSLPEGNHQVSHEIPHEMPHEIPKKYPIPGTDGRCSRRQRDHL